MLKKTMFFAGVFIQLLVVAAVFIIGWGMSFTTINLNTLPSKSGIVRSAGRQQTRGSRPIPGQMDLIIYLENEETGFWIYRASGNYSDIISALPAGDTVKIYYDSQVGSNGYHTAYQVETKKQVAYSKTAYEKKEQMGGRFLALPGAFILLVTLYYQSKKRYRLLKRVGMNEANTES